MLQTPRAHHHPTHNLCAYAAVIIVLLGHLGSGSCAKREGDAGRWSTSGPMSMVTPALTRCLWASRSRCLGDVTRTQNLVMTKNWLCYFDNPVWEGCRSSPDGLSSHYTALSGCLHLPDLVVNPNLEGRALRHLCIISSLSMSDVHIVAVRARAHREAQHNSSSILAKRRGSPSGARPGREGAPMAMASVTGGNRSLSSACHPPAVSAVCKDVSSGK